MFQKAKFELVNVKVPGKAKTEGNGGYSYNYKAEIVPLSTPDSSKEEKETNEKVCELLKMRVPSIPSQGGSGSRSTDRSINFLFDLRERDGSKVKPKVTVSGGILRELWLSMSYQAMDTRLKLKITAELEGNDWGRNSNAEEKLSYEAELRPSIEDGQPNLGKYRDHLQIVIDSEWFKDWGWEFKNIRLWVEGLVLDPSDCIAPMKDRLVIIQCKPDNRLGIQELDEDNSPIQVRPDILSSQSSIIKRRLDLESEFGEGPNLQFNMKGYTRKEVLALVNYLSTGCVKEASTDPELATRLYEMGYLYEMKNLKQVMKGLLLRMSSELFGPYPDSAINLFQITMKNPKSNEPWVGLADEKLNAMAADILLIKFAWKTTEGLRPLIVSPVDAMTMFGRRLFKMTHFPDKEGNQEAC